MKGNASLSKNRTRAGFAKEIEKMLDETQTTDSAEDKLYGKENRGDELPGTRKERLSRLQQAKAELDRRAEAERKDQADKISKREEEEKSTGKKTGSQAQVAG